MKRFLAMLALLASTQAMALDLNFSGTVSTSCSLAVGQAGTLALVPSQPSILSTGVSGGQPGIVNVTYIGTPTLTATFPTGFTTSPALGFSPTIGGSVTSPVIGTFPINAGVATGAYSTGSSDTVTITLIFDGGANSFPLGTYETTMVVTCS